MHGSHLEKGIGLSSKMVPMLAENWRLQPLQRHVMRDSISRTVGELQRGQQTAPSGHLRLTTQSHASRSLAKYRTAYNRVLGFFIRRHHSHLQCRESTRLRSLDKYSPVTLLRL